MALQAERRWKSHLWGANRYSRMEVSLLLGDGLKFGNKGISGQEGGGGAPGKQNRLQRCFCQAWLGVPHSGFGLQWKVWDAAQVGSDL